MPGTVRGVVSVHASRQEPEGARPDGLVSAQRAGAVPLERNSAWLMVSTLATSAIGYLFWIVAARAFDAKAVGVAGGIISLTTIAAVVANLGTAPALVRRLPGLPDIGTWSKTVSASLIAGAALGTLAGGAILLILPLLSDTLQAACHRPLARVMIVAATAVWVVGMVLDYAFIAERQGRLVAERGTLMGVGKLALLVALIAGGLDNSPTTIVASWVLAGVLAGAFGVLVMIPRVRPGFRVSARGTWQELRRGQSVMLGNHLVTVGNTLAPYLLPVVVVARQSATDNAFFYSTWMVGGVFFMISSATASSLFAEGVHDRSGLRRAFAAGARFTAVLLVPTMVVVFAAAPQILSLFGPEYADHGAPLLRILTLAAVPDAVTNLYVAVLRAEDRLVAGGVLTVGMSVGALLGAWIIAPGSSLAAIGLMWLLAQSAGSAWVGWDLLTRRRRDRGGAAQGSGTLASGGSVP